jgi:hypothetical protein
MILTCELCQNQFLIESDPHIVIPGQEIKIYCWCQVKGLEAENAKLYQEIEKFKGYLEAWDSNEL